MPKQLSSLLLACWIALFSFNAYSASNAEISAKTTEALQKFY